jgi:protein SCO1/2
MQNKQRGLMKTLIVLLAVVGLVLGLFVYKYAHKSASIVTTQFHGTWLEQPRTVSPFDLAGSKGPFNNASLIHHWTIMFFGFTTCPTICPTTMAELSQMMNVLKAQGVTPLPQVILVSLDPKRDTVSRLQHYVTTFNPDFIGARGANEAMVKALAKEMGVAYTKIASPRNQKDYNIEHTGTLMLFDPKGELTAFFTMPHKASLLAQDYQSAIAYYARKNPH